MPDASGLVEGTYLWFLSSKLAGILEFILISILTFARFRNGRLNRANAHPSQPRDIISSYLLSATIERNPEPRYAENDGAGGEEDRTNNVRTRIALATCLDGSAIKSIKNRKSIPFRFFSSARIIPIVVGMFTPGTLPLFRESSLR